MKLSLKAGYPGRIAFYCDTVYLHCHAELSHLYKFLPKLL